MNIIINKTASSAIRHAVKKLSRHTGIPVCSDKKANPAIRIMISNRLKPLLSEQGYIIRKEGPFRIIITANCPEGVLNGIYTFLRLLITERISNPFLCKWDIKAQPHFKTRGMIVAPYRFGGSFGYARLSPDMWSIDEWTNYIDLMRLCNMTTLTLITSGRMYHPDIPSTYREKWRFDVFKEVIEYCHLCDIKVNYIAFPNVVPQEIYWNNPDLRATAQEAGGYFGCGLDWNKAKDMILDINRRVIEYLDGLDGLEMLYSEAGFSFDPQTAKDPAAYFSDVTAKYRDMIDNLGSEKEFVFWNWLFDLWSKVVLPDELLDKYPGFGNIIDKLIPMLPKDITWTDASMLSTIQMFASQIKAAGNPALREGLLLGKKAGFKKIINCFWYLNPEYSINMLTHPFIRRSMQEAVYSANEIMADGVTGYRLAPPCRFIADYTFFRLASDPYLTQEMITKEISGFLCEKSKNMLKVKRATDMLEHFWSTHDLCDLKEAELLFKEAASNETSVDLANISNGVTFLRYITQLAADGVTLEAKNKLIRDLYGDIKKMDIFQGLTCDIIWQPESHAVFYQKAELMVKQYLWYKENIPDIVDRRIYEKATSEFFNLNWQDAQTFEKEESLVLDKKPGPLSF